MKKNRILWITASFVIVISLLLSACGGAATQAPPSSTEPPPAVEQPTQPPAEQPTQPPAETEAPAEVPANLPPAGQELVDAYMGKYKGTVVTMAGPFTDADAVKFENSILAFEEATGIDIQYSGS